MSAGRDDAIKAIDEAFSDGVKHLYGVMVQGLAADTPAPAELVRHFTNGLALQCDAHGKATAAVTNYFQGVKP